MAHDQKQVYKIGTRGSLLAVTQATQIKDLLTQKTGQSFELVTIKTQGDQQTDKPLWQMDGKDFFTKELDHALLKGEVDLVIHSYKDLGSDRPEGLTLAAITERRFPHDVLIMGPSGLKKLNSSSSLSSSSPVTLHIGTSSPRRIKNISEGLSDFLPHARREKPKLTIGHLRGNVNTRLQKLHDGSFDGIVLAMAGLERLAQSHHSLLELKELMKGVKVMILPLGEFPTAAAQGALAIEIHSQRNDSHRLKNFLQSIHHPATAEEVKAEKAAFKNYGGGCHLAVGITVQHCGAGFVQSERGEFEKAHAGKTEVKKRWLQLPSHLQPARPQQPLLHEHIFLGQGHHHKALCDEAFQKQAIPLPRERHQAEHAFLTSSHVLEAFSHLKDLKSYTTHWCAGSETWKKCAAQGVWIHGCADSMGATQISKFQHSALLQMLFGDSLQESKDWDFFSHQDARIEFGQLVACYKHQMRALTQDEKQQLSQVKYAYWSSYPQYLAYTEQVKDLKKAFHFCGPGKTYQEFLKHQLPVTPALNPESFLHHLGVLS